MGLHVAYNHGVTYPSKHLAHFPHTGRPIQMPKIGVAATYRHIHVAWLSQSICL